MNRANRKLPFVATMLIALGGWAISSAQGQVQINPGQPAPRVQTTPSLGRIHVPPMPYADASIASNRFGMDLFAKLRAAAHEQDNLFFSPYSISSALTMTRIGARGPTATEMNAALHLPDDLDKTQASYKSLADRLNTEGHAPDLSLTVANALWVEQTAKLLPDYVNAVKTQFGANVAPVDFATHADAARTQINQWVATATQDKIKDLLPGGAITPETRLVLTNAIYFKGKWQHPFEASRTSQADFHGFAKDPIRADFMFETERLSYAENDICQAVRLPYQGGLSMLILLPKPHQRVDGVRAGDPNPMQLDLADVENALNHEYVIKLSRQLTPHQVQLTLPKWRATQSFTLNNVLSQMGIKLAFSKDADFSGIDGATDLSISAVIHKTFINVDEAGTEAAAATAVVMRGSAVMPAAPPVQFTADHPFIYLILDDYTHTILFAGRLSNPTAE